MIVGCTSGYFNPLHKGHLALLKAAKESCQYLVVIINNDEQVKLKGSVPFMDQQERAEIVRAIRYVDHVVISHDTDKTVLQTLKMIHPSRFLKGGDSGKDNTPELRWCKEAGVAVYFGVGGDKIQSSSILKNQVKDTP